MAALVQDLLKNYRVGPGKLDYWQTQSSALSDKQTKRDRYKTSFK